MQDTMESKSVSPLGRRATQRNRAHSLLCFSQAAHLNSYSRLYYAENDTTSSDLWPNHHFDVHSLLMLQRTCLSSLLSLISVEFFQSIKKLAPTGPSTQLEVGTRFCSVIGAGYFLYI